MRQMIGLMMKDLMIPRDTYLAALFVLPLFVIFWWSFGDLSLTYFMIIICFGILSLSAIVEDEKARWEKFSLTLPFTRKEIVKQKFLLMGGLTVLAGFVMMLISFPLDYYYYPASVFGVSSITLIIFAVSMTLVGFSAGIYISYKYSAVYGMLSAVLFVMGMIFSGIFLLIGGGFFGAVEFLNFWCWILIPVTCAVFWIVYQLTVRTFERKEY